MALDIKTRVNEEVRNFVKSSLPGREVYCNYLSDSSKMPRCNRYIQVQTAFPSLERIHYKYINSHWEFHIEPPSESDGYRYGRISRYLREHIHDIPSLKWQNDGSRDMAVYQEEVCNDEQLKEWDAHLIVTVHDEVLVECKEEFAEQVADRLPKLMIAAAEELGIQEPKMKCDPYLVSRWYSDTMAGNILKEYSKAKEKGLSSEEAINKVIENHSELRKEAIIKTVETGCDLEF